MKKVLILAYDFPPYVSVGGLRPYYWYKHLYEFDVYPIVVTRQWNNKYGNYLDYIAPSESSKIEIEQTEIGEIIKTPYVPNFANKLMLKYGESKFIFLRKIVSAFYDLFQWVFIIGPKSQLYFAADNYLKTNTVDIIVVTGNPFILFKYASKLSKKYSIPWFADYRDSWSQDIFIKNNFFSKHWNTFLEKKYSQNSLLSITVGDLYKKQINSLLNNKTIFIIPNGYDSEAIQNVSKINQTNEILNIGYAGTIYEWHPIKSFLNVVSNFITKNKSVELRINFYGINIESELNKMISIEFPDLKSTTFIFPKKTNHILMQLLAKNNIMLLFNDYDVSGTKIFDYLGLKRTIILCYKDDMGAKELKNKFYKLHENNSTVIDVQEDIINNTNSGVVAKDANHLLILLENFYAEFKKNGFIKCNSINTEQFSRKFQVQKLAEIIKQNC